MKRKEIFNSLKSIIKDIVGFDVEEMNEQSSLFNDLGLDSLDAVELIMKCEKKYNIKISDNVVKNIHSVSDLIDIINLLNTN